MHKSRIIFGDNRQTLQELIAEGVKVQTCITSPPYFGLRDYGTAKWEGGDTICDHRKNIAFSEKAMAKSTIGAYGNTGHAQEPYKKICEKCGAVRAQWEGGDTICDHVQDLSKTKKFGNEEFNKNAPSRELTKTKGYYFKDVCGKCGAVKIDAQIGLEETPEEYVSNLVEIFRLVKEILADDGTLWLNLGDSYFNTQNSNRNNSNGTLGGRGICEGGEYKTQKRTSVDFSLKPKDLIGIPWLVALALRAEGYYLRQDIIWCLSGGTWVYAKTKKGEMPIMIREISRLKTGTVELWNGKKWTKVLGWSKSKRKGTEVEIELRSGERISCSKNHRWPTVNKGLVVTEYLKVGDILESSTLPEPTIFHNPNNIPDYLGWFVGMYLAEGSKSNDTIQISGNKNEESFRFSKLQDIAKSFDGSCFKYDSKGESQTINLNSKVLNGILDLYISGKIAKNKGLSNACWMRSNKFLQFILEGYLEGDGHWDPENNRWRLGFTRNYSLEKSLRLLCARLGYKIRLKLSESTCNGKKFKSFRGEIKFKKSSHLNSKSQNEIVSIRKARCREVYDIGVSDDPHLFTLASGVLTHNSKPNCMPESVTDRCTKSHEYLFLLTKNPKYYYDADAIKEPYADSTYERISQNVENQVGTTRGHGGLKTNGPLKALGKYEDLNEYGGGGTSFKGHSGYVTKEGKLIGNGMRNKRDVWWISPQAYKGSHFATFPTALVLPCIQAGTKKGDLVLDPFAGSGTVGEVAKKMGREYILLELNKNYEPLIRQRLDDPMDISNEPDEQKGLFY